MQALQTSTVILAFKNEVVADVFALAFEGVFLTRVIACADAEAAAKALEQHPDACVLVEGSFPEVSLHRLFQVHVSFAKRAVIFLLGGHPRQVPTEFAEAQVRFLPAKPDISAIIAEAEKSFSLEARAQQFCRITLKSLLIRSDKLRCDVYIKLSEDKFVKVLHANDRFDLEEYERFKQKKVNFLYLPRADFLGLMNELLTKVASLNEAPETVSLDQAMDTSAAIFETVHAAFQTEGFTPQLQKLTVASVELAIHTIKKNPKLGELLGRLDSHRDSYLSWHSTALSFLACKLATMLGWQSETTFFKLSLASLIHDLPLESDELAQLQTIAEIDAAGLSPFDRERLIRHPLAAAQLVSGFEEIPGEVAFIVEQHHERQDGSGFPRGLDHRDVSSISALFIIAHDIVATMFAAPPANFVMKKFLADRDAEKIYAKGSFGQVFQALLKHQDEM